MMSKRSKINRNLMRMCAHTYVRIACAHIARTHAHEREFGVFLDLLDHLDQSAENKGFFIANYLDRCKPYLDHLDQT